MRVYKGLWRMINFREFLLCKEVNYFRELALC
ncbi:hypothetical protein ABIC55_000237 [Sporosarcina psychrophila]|uniref:Transposase n=1 Tax=Sporosarcina psychrophila TaxID=1476 RepID=A0ABV2K246_SPOPS